MDPLDVGKEAAAAAGEVLQQYFRSGLEIREKGTCDLVSDADIEAERIIVDVIRKYFPDHNILGEEGTQPASLEGPLWVIDPLDGTTNFAHGIPHFATSIGYFEDRQPIASVINNPVRNDCFSAALGRGSFWNDQRMQVSDERQLNQTLIGLGFYYDRDVLMNATLNAIRDLFQFEIHGIRRMGAASLDLVAVGCGMLGAFFEYTLSTWDFAGGMLFVTEAGGKVTTCKGNPLRLEHSSVLATNGHLHESVRAVVEKYQPQIDRQADY